jgi:hypothetical protein
MRGLNALSPAADRAAAYARFGLWPWAGQLIDAERSAGRDVPPLLAARAHWMCNDLPTARRYFQQAVAGGEIPQWYVEACLAAGSGGRIITPLPAAPRGADPQAPAAVEPLAAGVISAADISTLQTMIGTENEVVVEGTVLESKWSKQGKHMTVLFAGSEGKTGLVCTLSRKDREAFDAAFDGDVASALAGKRLRVRGEIVNYDGKSADLKGWPQIVLKDPKQVQILK